MESDHIVACFRVADTKKGHVVEGVTRDKCTKCGEEVFISPETAIRKNEIKAAIYCVQCAIERVKQSERVALIPPSEGQIEELRKDIEYRKNQFKLN
jgi:flavoprotein